MPIFYEEIVDRITREGSVPENDARYTESNIIELVNSRMKYYIVPLINELAVNFFVISVKIPLVNSDGSQRFLNNIIPFPHRGVGRGLRDIKWMSQGYEYRVPRKGLENDIIASFYSPFVYDVVGEGIRICAFNNSSSDMNSQLSGDLIFYYAISPPKVVSENISAPLVQLLYDIDNKVTYFTLDTSNVATDFPLSGQVLTDIVSTKGKAFYTTNCMIYFYSNSSYGPSGSNYSTYKTDEYIPWSDLDARQSLGFRILNMPGDDRISIYSTLPSDIGKQITIQGYDAKSSPVILTVTLDVVPVKLDLNMRFIYQLSMVSPMSGDIIIQNGVSFQFAKIPTGINNCKVGSVLPYEASDIYLNKSGKSSFLVIPDEAIELLILLTALNILQNQGDTEAFSIMEKRVSEAKNNVMNVLKDTVVGSPEVIVNDYGLDKFLTTSWTRYW